MTNMDLHTFYRHSLQMKHQDEEAAALAAKEHEEEIRQGWKEIADTIRKALPIEGMVIMETLTGQFNEYPSLGRLIDLDCVIDPSLKEHVKHGEGNLMHGVIRVRVYWTEEDENPTWDILKYIVWVDGKATEFDAAHYAFLAAYQALEVRAE
jgi:hypothetical protein